MNKKLLDKYKNRSELIKALAHPARLFMVDFVKNEEKCVCEIVDKLKLDQSTVSKHLAILKKQNILEDRKEGLKVFYKLKCPCILEIFNCIENLNK